MAIRTTRKSKLHWNYFIALENDLGTLQRYIEFCDANLGVFSLELAHLLLASASEVDVLAKCVCTAVAPTAKCRNIDEYRNILNDPNNLPFGLNPLPEIEVSVPRYGLVFCPWENWAQGKNPDWWTSYNNVKHQRDKHFKEATLQNALNSLAALLILNVFHYRLQRNPDKKVRCGPKQIMLFLRPASSLLSLPSKYYDDEYFPDALAYAVEARLDEARAAAPRSDIEPKVYRAGSGGS